MSFDVKKFQNAKFIQRTEDVKVEALKSFFGEKEQPVFKVRNLSGEELGRVNQAVQKHKDIAKHLDGLLSGNAKEQIEVIKESLGLTDKTPADIARRLEMLQLGCIEPKLDIQTCVKLCTYFPIEFYDLTNTITRLTGLGSELGKPKPFGKTKK